MVGACITFKTMVSKTIAFTFQKGCEQQPHEKSCCDFVYKAGDRC